MTAATDPLPDPLVMADGRPIRSRKQWVQQRRSELKALFQHHMYGYFPPATKNLRPEILFEEPRHFGGNGTLKEVRLKFGPKDAPPIYLLMAIPSKRRKRAPVLVGANFCGNHTLVDCAEVRLPTVWVIDRSPGPENNRATAAGRGKRKARFQMEYAVSRGYAVASYYAGDMAPDKPDFTDGIHPHYFKKGQHKPRLHDWGAIAAWAWGLQRCVDYLVSDGAIDPKRIATVGHSRMGKTALLAAAFDDRIALAIPHQAGCGGTAPSRGTIGESVKQINTAFPHWFNDYFPRYNDRVHKLPFDQHDLVALMAPRPVLFTNAKLDQWANPRGQFEVLRAADRVYRLLGVEGLSRDRFPPMRTLVDNRLGYHIRDGRHSMGRRDWKVFLDYADRWL